MTEPSSISPSLFLFRSSRISVERLRHRTIIVVKAESPARHSCVCSHGDSCWIMVRRLALQGKDIAHWIMVEQPTDHGHDLLCSGKTVQHVRSRTSR